MYENFYGLSGKPFSLLPDGDAVFASHKHRRALALLEYGIVSHSGFVVISGEIGAGKTTILRHFLNKLDADFTVGLITNPSASAGRMLDWIVSAFNIKERGAHDTSRYNGIVEFLHMQRAHEKRAILVVDEAQNLTAEMLEELRMLSNINNERDMLLQMVLVGQQELLDTLRRPELRQLVQRVAAHCHLDPLSAAETAAYIRYRLGLVGGSPQLFDERACAAVYRFTGGIPRLINLLCDQALVYGFSEDMTRISSEIVAEVVRDRGSFGLSAFRNAPEDFSAKTLENESVDLLHEIGQKQNEEMAA